MDQQLIEKVMKQVSDELGIRQEECKAEAPKEECSTNIGLTEFVGTAIGDTIGLVIASVDPMLVDVMKWQIPFHRHCRRQGWSRSSDLGG